MEELKPAKGKKLIIPKSVKRYCVAYYTKTGGWRNDHQFHATPENALEWFLSSHRNWDDERDGKLFYTIYELDLEIPIY